MKNWAIRTAVLGSAAIALAQAQTGGFGGPSILSRGGGGYGASRGQAIGISAYGSLQAIYNQGFSPIKQTDSVTVPRLSGGGLLVDGGLVGYYQRQRHATSFTVRGLYSNNQAGSNYNNYGVNLEFAHSQQISRRTTIFLSVTGGKTNYSGQVLYRFSEEPVAQTVNPGFEIFDNHLTTVSMAAGATYQMSNRWSFSAQGAAFGADRREKGLADTRGVNGSGSVQYSLSRRTAVGVSGSYSWFYFPGMFGETTSESGLLFLNHTFGRRWTAFVNGGMYSAYTQRLATVPLDPLIAELTGQATGLQIFRRRNSGWIGGGGLTLSFRNSGLTGSYARSLQAGNGVYLTSVSDVISGNYTYRARNSWAFSLMASYSKLKAITQQIGNGEYRTAGVSVSHRLNSFINVIGTSGFFNTNVFNGRFARNRVYVSAGIQFAPHDIPILR